MNKFVSKEPFKSIVYLTRYFEDKEKGLRQLHYRWALIENHDNINDKIINKNMESFFSKSPKHIGGLKELEEEGIIKTNIISGKYPSNNLNNILTRLSDKYKILEKKKDENGVSKYALSKEFIDTVNVSIFMEYIDTFKGVFDFPLLYSDLKGSHYSEMEGLIEPAINKSYIEEFFPKDPLVFYDVNIKNEIANFILFSSNSREDQTDKIKSYVSKNEKLLYSNNKTYFLVAEPVISLLFNTNRDIFQNLTNKEIEKINEYCRNLNEFSIFLNGLKYRNTGNIDPVNIWWGSLNSQVGIIGKYDKNRWYIQSSPGKKEKVNTDYFTIE